MTLALETARSAGTRPVEVVKGKKVLMPYFDACSVVAPPDAAKKHRGVVPAWVPLANESLDFLAERLPRDEFEIIIQSEAISQHFEKRFEPLLEPLHIDVVLPGFGKSDHPPVRIWSLTSSDPNSSSMRVVCGKHPSAPMTRLEVEGGTRVKVRTQHTRCHGPLAAARRSGSSLGPVCCRCCSAKHACQKRRSMCTTGSSTGRSTISVRLPTPS